MNYGKIYHGLWGKRRFRALSDEGRLLLIYFMTCKHSTLCGMYFLPIEYISGDLKWDQRRVFKALKELIGHDWVAYDEENQVLLVRWWLDFYQIDNPNQLKRLMSDFDEVPGTDLMQVHLNELTQGVAGLREEYARRYVEECVEPRVTGLPAVRVVEEAEEAEAEPLRRPDEVPAFEQVVNHLNISTGREFQHTNPNTRRLISGRWAEGYRVVDFMAVIDAKVIQWFKDPKMKKFLRPETLFGATKFEGYLQEAHDKGGGSYVEKTYGDGDVQV
ncbi:MAG TPA: conserved phage C-terminal domain-containing protein [Armatimonadota bacterium]|nr:conserved phage C-terminal domain-containing protein [Armatimonadota bacterium]